MKRALVHAAGPARKNHHKHSTVPRRNGAGGPEHDHHKTSGTPLFAQIRTLSEDSVGRLEQHAETVASHIETLASPPDGRGRPVTVPAPGPSHVPPGPGTPLDHATRAYMERRIGDDFGDVRVHTGRQATLAARTLGARAYASGSHIVFGADRYDPVSPTGRRVLAHELTHVAQQKRRGRAAVQRRVGGDVTQMSITPQFASDLTDDELSGQIRIVRDHMKTLRPSDMEHDSMRDNRRILENEQVMRYVRGNRNASPDSRDQSVSARLSRFKQGVLIAAKNRLTENQENLEQWRNLIDSQFSAPELQRQVLAQSATDLDRAATVHHGQPAFQAWAGTRNPYMRWVYEQQVRGRYRACTGCHAMNEAIALGMKERHSGPAWTAPSVRLAREAGMLPPGASFYDPTGFARLSGADAQIVRLAVSRIRPIIAPLGESGYKIIPDDVFSLSSNATPDELRATIMARIDMRKADYETLKRRIDNGSVSYLDLGPVLSALLPMADADVRKEVKDEQDWEHTKAILTIGATLIASLLSILFPPLMLAVAAVQFAGGAESASRGYSYKLGTGADDVFSRQQQDMADQLIASGVLNMAMAAAVFAQSTPGALDWSANRIITASDVSIAQNIARRALSGPVSEAELLQLQQQGLVTRLAQRWTSYRGYQILYRGQSAASSEILSPIARQSGTGASRSMYDALKAQGMSDLEIAGYTARWNDQPVPAFNAPPGMADQPLGGAGIPTSRLPNVASDFATGESGVMYVLRVPKSIAHDVGSVGWGMQSAIEQEFVIFHQIPGGYVVRTMSPAGIPPLRYDSPPGVGPSLVIPPAGGTP